MKKIYSLQTKNKKQNMQMNFYSPLLIFTLQFGLNVRPLLVERAYCNQIALRVASRRNKSVAN